MKRLVRGEKGYILIAALLVLVVLGLISGPLLSYMVSGLKAGHVFETGAAELYAADAGVEDAVVRIPNAGLCPNQSTHYTISDVNGKSVDVTVTLTDNVTGILTYRITSIAVTYDSVNTAAIASGTKVESYLLFTPGGELDIFSGALASQSGITLGKNSTVNGDIYHCGAFDNSNIVNNDWTDKGCGQFPQQTENVAFANTMKTLAMAETTYPNGLTIDQDVNLGPAYIIGDLDTSKDVTVSITGVVYVTGSVKMSKEFTLAGCGILIAEGSISIFKVADGFGSTCDAMIMSLNGDISFKKEGVINALIYAPNGTIDFRMKFTVLGGVVGNYINAEKNEGFTYIQRSSWDLPGQLPGAYTIEAYDVSRLN
jgi:cytoskeletal protein CcmA (bactofilin family)